MIGPTYKSIILKEDYLFGTAKSEHDQADLVQSGGIYHLRVAPSPRAVDCKTSGDSVTFFYFDDEMFEGHDNNSLAYALLGAGVDCPYLPEDLKCDEHAALSYLCRSCRFGHHETKSNARTISKIFEARALYGIPGFAKAAVELAPDLYFDPFLAPFTTKSVELFDAMVN